MFIRSGRPGPLHCFVWNYQKRGEGYEIVAMWFSFVYVLLCSVSYRLEQKSPKYSSKWTLKVGNFCKVALQPEGAHSRHSETIIN